MLLTFWFTLTTLIGPGLCCCTLRAALPATESIQPRCSCCEVAADGHSEKSKPDCPDQEKCPCKRGQCTTESLPPSTESTKTTTAIGLQYWLDAATMSEPFGHGALEVTTLAHAPNRPFHSTDDLLHVFHILRC